MDSIIHFLSNLKVIFSIELFAGTLVPDGELNTPAEIAAWNAQVMMVIGLPPCAVPASEATGLSLDDLISKLTP